MRATLEDSDASCLEIAAAVGLNKRTIERMKECFELFGEPYVPKGASRTGRVSHLTEEQVQWMLRFLESYPTTYLDEMEAVLFGEFGVAGHLWWRRGPRRDNLVCWSSSMLCLIHYIFYRHYDKNAGSSLRDIRILVTDTENFPARTFIRDTDLISAFKAFDSREKDGLKRMDWLRSHTHHYFGEYLSQGSLNISGKCRTVSAQAMIERGLFDLHDVFVAVFGEVQQATWAKPVHTARETVKTASSLLQAPLEVVSSAFKIALDFGEDFRLPVAIQLLAVLPYDLDATLVYRRLCADIRPTSKHASEAVAERWEMTHRTAYEVSQCAAYWQTLHALPSMHELSRGKSTMNRLFKLHLQGTSFPDSARVMI